jgi:hypothetical protein
LIVAGVIAWLNVALTVALFGQMAMSPSGGVTTVTVAGTVGHDGEVVKVQSKALSRVLPKVSAAPVVIVAVYVAFAASAVEGVNVATNVAVW